MQFDQAEDDREMAQVPGSLQEETRKAEQPRIDPAILQSNYGQNLIKTFKDDVNQIIHEESREESMSISMMNSSKLPDGDLFNSQSISIDKSKYTGGRRSPQNIVNLSKSIHSLSRTADQQDFDKVIEIQEIGESEDAAHFIAATSRSRMPDLGTGAAPDVVRRSCTTNQTLNLDDTDLRVQESMTMQASSLDLGSIQICQEYLPRDSSHKFKKVSSSSASCTESSQINESPIFVKVSC